MSATIKSMLGELSAITISSRDLEISKKFYEKLGFKEVFQTEFPFPVILMGDGALHISLRKDEEPFLSITYFAKEPESIVSRLESDGITFIRKSGTDEMVKRYIFQSPDKLNISLVSNLGVFSQPAGPTMLTMPQADYFNPAKYVNQTCGMFGELAHPVADLNLSLTFWEKLGFSTLSKFESPYPWAIMTDGLHVLGMHQTKNFSHPALTFFASDMKDKIDRLIKNGLTEYTGSGGGNITITTPEHQHINLFSLGM